MQIKCTIVVVAVVVGVYAWVGRVVQREIWILMTNSNNKKGHYLAICILGRGKPGWGKESTRPPWWPKDVPWANVRMDARSEDQKQKVRLHIIFILNMIWCLELWLYEICSKEFRDVYCVFKLLYTQEELEHLKKLHFHFFLLYVTSIFREYITTLTIKIL